MHMYHKVGIPGCLAAPGPDQLALAEAGVSPLEAGRHDVTWVTERFLYIKLSELVLKYILRMCRQDDICYLHGHCRCFLFTNDFVLSCQKSAENHLGSIWVLKCSDYFADFRSKNNLRKSPWKKDYPKKMFSKLISSL
jgi:hypothetical protein